jgi:4-hydroxy-3-methylbut-2-enyl diphosphate reductase
MTSSACFATNARPGSIPRAISVRIGVVNQTTMLATETHEIAAALRRALADRYGESAVGDHFADTSDTLCYATNENQNATYALIEHGADLAIVVGGYNSSNTSHLVELCAEAMPTYFVQGADDLMSENAIRHFSLARRAVETTSPWLPTKRPLDVVLTCGASCPDAILDEVLKRLLSMFDDLVPLEDVLSDFLPMAGS